MASTEHDHTIAEFQQFQAVEGVNNSGVRGVLSIYRSGKVHCYYATRIVEFIVV